MSEIFQRIASEFIPMLEGVAKDKFAAIETEPSEKPEVAVSFKIDGDISGSLVAVFYSSQNIAKRFLDVTIGDSSGVDLNEACQEIANQVVGRILGAVGDMGVEVEISYPGVIMSAGEIDVLSAGRKVIYAQSPICGVIGLKAVDCNEPELFESKTENVVSTEGNKKVLIVDDSPVMCAFLEKIFVERNYEVVGKAADGVEALEMFEKFDPDLVTLDIVMPKLKGTEVLKRIIELRPDATVVMASSVSDARTVMNCLKMGAKRYIVKPYDRTAVITAVEKALGLVEKN